VHSFPSWRAAAAAAALLPALAGAAPLTLDEAVRLAVQRSEMARSAKAGVASASEAARAAGQLPDPMLGVSIENLPIAGAERFSTGREGMTMKRIALSQEWVPQGKRDLRTAAAQAAVAREAAAAAGAIAEARLQAALAFVDLHFAARAAQLATSGEHHASEALRVARARLAGAGGNAPDVLAAAAAQGMAADEAHEARQQLSAAAVNFARWTGAAGEDLAAPAPAPRIDEQKFIDRHPQVVTKRRELDMARSEAAAAAANRRPNWTWEVAYGQRAGMSDLVSVGVSIPLPVAPGARQDRETGAKLALADKAEADLAEATRVAQAEYRMLASDAQRLEARIRAFESGVLAPASQRMAASTAALAGNQASVAMTFEARHAELAARRKLLALQRELARVHAQLAFKPVREEDMP